MQINVKSRIDSIISDLEAKLSKWKAVRDAVGDDAFREEMLTLLVGDQTPTKSNGKRKPAKSGKKSLLLEKLQDFYRAHGNQWATLAEIEEKGVLNKSQARQLLYISHADYFDRQSNATGDRQTKFRLKESAS